MGRTWLLGALLLGACGAGGEPTAAERKAAADRVARDQQAQIARQRAALERLPADVRALRERHATLMGAASPDRRKVDAAATASGLRQLSRDARALRDNVGEAHGDAVAELERLRDEVQKDAAIAERLLEALRSRSQIASLVARARGTQKADSPAGTVQLCDEALKAEGALRGIEGTWAERLGPPKAEVARLLAPVRAMRQRAAAAVERSEAKARKERERAEALIAVCGSAPTVSPWDGELAGLESHIEATAHDPDSIDVENCTKPLLYEKACWVSTCDVRGRNMLGALILKRRTFRYARGVFSEE